MDNGELSDVRGFSRHSFYCQYEYRTPIITNITDQCYPCKMLIDDLRMDLMIKKLISQFHTFCGSKLQQYFKSKSIKFCSNVGYSLHQLADYFKEHYLDTYDICSTYQICNEIGIEIPNEICSKCKFIFKELKGSIQGLQFQTFFGKYMPYIINFFTLICLDISVDCQNLDIEKIIKELISFEPGFDNFANTICTNIGICKK